ncbi:MAG: hypothetical protein ABG776_02665 [Cyanobacteria bacterium J06555_13]
MSAKLQRLLEKEAQLKAQIQQAKAAERTLEKKRDTRRKILIGAAVMARVEHGEWPKDDLLAMMDGFLTRQNERDLFGLDGDGADDVGGAQPEAEPQAKGKAEAGKKRPQGKKQARMMPESNLDIEAEFNL